MDPYKIAVFIKEGRKRLVTAVLCFQIGVTVSPQSHFLLLLFNIKYQSVDSIVRAVVVELVVILTYIKVPTLVLLCTYMKIPQHLLHPAAPMVQQRRRQPRLRLCFKVVLV